MLIDRYLSTDPNAPYAKAVRANGFIFVTGQVGEDANDELVPGGIEAEARQAIENMQAILAHFGAGLEHVVKVMVWLTDPKEVSVFNAIYKEYFGKALPARACVRAELMGPYKVELEAIAVDPKA